jgi:hypothetical protein
VKQRDIERVMAAAWAWHDDPDADFRLRVVLYEVDPNGVYRADSLQVPTSVPHEPYATLRNSPRMLRTADEAGGHD